VTPAQKRALPRDGKIIGTVPTLPAELVVGREPGSTGIALDGASAAVSRRHCVLTRTQDGEILIRDTSKNGTTVNGRSLEVNKPTKLRLGDVIVVEGWPRALQIAPKFSIRAVPRKVGSLLNEWAYLHFVVSKPEYHRRGAWLYWGGARSRGYSPWKIHIYADSPEQYMSVVEYVAPFLQHRDLAHKTVSSLERLYDLWLVDEGRQKGKAFTVYFTDEDQMATVAKELHQLIKKCGVKRPDATIHGDRPLGSTGLLFYRFDQDGRGKYRPNDGVYKPKGVRDPFVKLARELR
jgi:hypothetical protein